MKKLRAAGHEGSNKTGAQGPVKAAQWEVAPGVVLMKYLGRWIFVTGPKSAIAFGNDWGWGSRAEALAAWNKKEAVNA